MNFYQNSYVLLQNVKDSLLTKIFLSFPGFAISCYIIIGSIPQMRPVDFDVRSIYQLIHL